MANSSVSIRYLILGILSQQAMSGYDIKRFLESLGWLIGSPSFGSLYPTLHTLRKDDLVVMNIIASEDKPPRKIYSITKTGKQALQDWSDQPVLPSVSLKSFVMRLLLGSNFSPLGLLTHLEQRRLQVATHQADLAKATKDLDDTADIGQRLAFEYSLALANAELAWLNNALEQLSQKLPTAEVMKGNSTNY